MPRVWRGTFRVLRLAFYVSRMPFQIEGFTGTVVSKRSLCNLQTVHTVLPKSIHILRFSPDVSPQ